MKTEVPDFKELKSIRQEIHILKNRINLIEAVLDIQEWKHDQSVSENSEQKDDDFDLKISKS